MNVAHIHLRGAPIRSVDHCPAADTEQEPYVAIRLAEGARFTLIDGDSLKDTKPDSTTLYTTPAHARALATLILKELPAEDDCESCPECGGCGIVERSIANGPNYSQDVEALCPNGCKAVA